jgi:hypothetical protein
VKPSRPLSEILAHIPEGTRFYCPDGQDSYSLDELRAQAAAHPDLVTSFQWFGTRAGGMRAIGRRELDGSGEAIVLVEEMASGEE